MNRSYQYEQSLFRARDGMIFGVCKGVARYLNVSTALVRIIFVVLLLHTGFMPLLVGYCLAAMLMKPEPVMPFRDEGEEEFYTSYTSSRSMALARLKRSFDSIDHRIRRLEDIVTDRDFDWQQRFHQ